jgi:ketosteroid isomerase-like protein
VRPGWIISKEMSEQNADLVRDLYRAASERNLEPRMARFDEDVELDVRAIAPEEGMYRGPEGIRDYFKGIWDIAATFVFEIEDLIEAGDQVVVTQRVRVVGAASGVDVSQTYGAVWRIADGKVTAIRLYPEPAQARQAAGV